MFDVKEIQMSCPGPIHSIKARAQPKRLKPCKVPTVQYLLYSTYYTFISVRVRGPLPLIHIYTYRRRVLLKQEQMDLLRDIQKKDCTYLRYVDNFSCLYKREEYSIEYRCISCFLFPVFEFLLFLFFLKQYSIQEFYSFTLQKDILLNQPSNIY